MREIGPRPAGEHPRPAHWERIRQAALGRDQGCRTCGDTSGLEVHHRTYERWGREDLDDVTVLCRGCHDAVTGLMMRIRDERRQPPAERVVVQIERFASPAVDIREPPAREVVFVERPPAKEPASLLPPVRVTVEVDRLSAPKDGELPLPRRNRV